MATARIRACAIFLLITFLLLARMEQPLLHIAALQLLKLCAVFDSLKTLPHRPLRSRCAMAREKLLNVVMHFCGAKAAQRGNSAATAKAGNFFLQIVPVRFQIFPGNFASR